MGTLATSHTVLNPTLRAPMQLVTGSSTGAGRVQEFSRQLGGKFFSDNSLSATKHREEIEARHSKKVHARRGQMEKTVEEYYAKQEALRKEQALKRRREQARKEKRFAVVQEQTDRCTSIQAMWRGYHVREANRKQHAAALKLQAPMRRWSARRQSQQARLNREFARQRFQAAAEAAAVIQVQKNFRRCVARRALRFFAFGFVDYRRTIVAQVHGSALRTDEGRTHRSLSLRDEEIILAMMMRGSYLR